MKTIIGAACLVACLLPTPADAQTGDAPGVDAVLRTERLAALGRVWGHAKYLHPALGYRPDIDWDSALVAAIPRVRAAGTGEDYAAAVQSMLAVLEDPLTRVVEATAATGSGAGLRRESGYTLTRDSVLIVTAGDYYTLAGSATPTATTNVHRSRSRTRSSSSA